MTTSFFFHFVFKETLRRRESGEERSLKLANKRAENISRLKIFLDLCVKCDVMKSKNEYCSYYKVNS